MVAKSKERQESIKKIELNREAVRRQFRLSPLKLVHVEEKSVDGPGFNTSTGTASFLGSGQTSPTYGNTKAQSFYKEPNRIITETTPHKPVSPVSQGNLADQNAWERSSTGSPMLNKLPSS